MYQPEPPYQTIEEEFEARIKKAVVEKGWDTFVIQSRREGFQLAMSAYGVSRGWLEGGIEQIDSQSSAAIYRLTDKGRKYFGHA